MDCLRRYQSKETINCLFDPSRQAAFTNTPERLKRCYVGHAPTLYTLNLAFGDGAADAWLNPQLVDIAEFSGSHDKLTTMQIDNLCRTIAATYGYLKITELMHFFLLFKSGKFGKFYGAVDALVITEALHSYCETERDHLLMCYENEAKEEQAAAERKKTQEESLSQDEWRDFGWLWRMGYAENQIREFRTYRPEVLHPLRRKEAANENR